MSRVECWFYGLFTLIVLAWMLALYQESAARYGGPDLHRPAPTPIHCQP